MEATELRTVVLYHGNNGLQEFWEEDTENSSEAALLIRHHNQTRWEFYAAWLGDCACWGETIGECVRAAAQSIRIELSPHKEWQEPFTWGRMQLIEVDSAVRREL